MTGITEGVWGKVLDRLAPKPNPYALNPAGWVQDRLGEDMWSVQRQVLESVRDHRKTVVVSCNGVGKDWVGARAAGWFVDTHPPDRTLVATTAPTGDQVKGIIWQELVTVHAGGTSRNPLAGKITQTEWWVGRHQVGVGRKTSEHAAAASLGYHDDYLLILIDEVQGVPATMITDIERLTTADDVPGYSMQRILAIGNPDYEGSPLWHMCQPGSGWNAILISYDQTPNWTGEVVPLSVSAHLIGHAFVEDRANKFGVDSPQYVTSVLGKFPKDATHGVVPLSWVRQCQGEAARSRAGEVALPVELGVDVGGSETGDWTVVAGREGMRAMPFRDDWHIRVGALESEAAVDMIVGAIRETHATAVKVDEGGVGYGIVGSLARRVLDPRERIDWPVAVVPVNAGEASPMVDRRGRPRFANIKAEMWWEIGRGLSKAPGRWDLSDLDEIEVAQLTDMRYSTDKFERIVIEPKADVKERTGRSPDDADARLLAYYQPRPVTKAFRSPVAYRDLRGAR